MRDLRVCPNCGHPATGTRCKWCHYVFPTETSPTEKAGQPTAPAVENSAQALREPAAKVKPEAPAKSNTLAALDAQHHARRIANSAEQTARDLAAKVKTEASTKSAQIISSARQKADEILWQAEQAAAALTGEAKAEAGKKSAEIISEARQKEALDLAKGRARRSGVSR